MCSPSERTVIIGIDPAASHLASVTAREGRIGAVQPDLCDTSKVSFGSPWHTTHTGLAMQWAWDILGVARAYGDPVVYLEEPLVGRGGVKSTMVQAFTSGAVQAAFAMEGVPVHLVNVGTWKKEVLGNGRADKPAVMELVRHRWPDAAVATGGDQDLADAAAIAMYGCAQLRLQHRLAGKG